MLKKFNKSKFILVFLFITLLITFTGCGKNEGAVGTVGAASGAILGSVATSKKHRAAGALVGALVGNLIGREVGKAQDEEEESLKEETNYYKRQVARADEENRRLKKSMEKWCYNCGRKVNLNGAHSCPYCGGELIREKVCRCCATSFNADSPYKYCPYCKDRVLLAGR